MAETKPPTAEELRNSNIDKGNVRNDSNKKSIQPHPESYLDIHNVYIVPQTGKAPIQADLKDMYVMTREGKTISLYNLFSAINPDIRLSNLTPEQETYVQAVLECQMMFHQLECPLSAFTSDSLRASVTEPSLARGGFLAKNIQTIRQQSEHLQVEQSQPQDRGFLSKIGLGK